MKALKLFCWAEKILINFFKNKMVFMIKRNIIRECFFFYRIFSLLGQFYLYFTKQLALILYLVNFT